MQIETVLPTPDANILHEAARQNQPDSSRLGKQAKAVLRYLRACSRGHLGIIPKQDTIAARLKIGLATVKRALKELRKTGWIESRRRGPTSSQYFLLQQAVTAACERSFERSSELSSSAGLYINSSNRSKEECTVVRKPAQRESVYFDPPRTPQKSCSECGGHGWKEVQQGPGELPGAVRCGCWGYRVTIGDRRAVPGW